MNGDSFCLQLKKKEKNVEALLTVCPGHPGLVFHNSQTFWHRREKSILNLSGFKALNLNHGDQRTHNMACFQRNYAYLYAFHVLINVCRIDLKSEMN